VNVKGKRIVADVSTLILLAKAESIEMVLEHGTILIPQAVYKEAIEMGKERGLEDAYRLEKLYLEGKIQTQEPSKVAKERVRLLFGLRGGECDVLALAQESGIDNVLTDDKRTINACKVLGLRFATALNALVALTRQGIMDSAKAEATLKELETLGWYNEMLIDRVRRDLRAS
jgi:predicted nucleic acid-binding protein